MKMKVHGVAGQRNSPQAIKELVTTGIAERTDVIHVAV
jgi:hypothetical protein